MDNAPELFYSDAKNVDHFIIEDLLDFPNDGGADGGLEAALAPGVSTDSSTATAVEPVHNFHTTGVGGAHAHFSSEFCVPYDDLAELEWLSNFEEESFSSDDLQKLQLIQGITARTNGTSEPHQYQSRPEIATRACPMLRPEVSVPAKARSKRSRAAPGNWTSRLLAVSPPPTAALSSSSESELAQPAARPVSQKKRESGPENSGGGGEGRRCLHCATDKTPQWRTGPMGPKTLCNACGVRFKSGRLVPEYRPASSPTFVLTKHSNSHRKVLELRRQKEMLKGHQNQQDQFMSHHRHLQSMVFDVSNGEDYLIHQHIGPDYRQLI